MGVQAGTATAVIDKFPDLGGADGFTDGDPKAGIDATQCDESWFNAVTEEVNAFIASASDDVLTPLFDPANRRQMAAAFFIGLSRQLGSNLYGSVLWSRRTFTLTSPTTAEKDWRNWLVDGFKKNVADNTVQTLGGISLPDNSQAILEFNLTIVQTTAIANYRNECFKVSARKIGGTVTVQNFSSIYGNGALGVTAGPVASSGSVALQVTIPASPGTFYNLHVSAVAVNVTTSTAT